MQGEISSSPEDLTNRDLETKGQGVLRIVIMTQSNDLSALVDCRANTVERLNGHATTTLDRFGPH
jgi:hypothetical protein